MGQYYRPYLKNEKIGNLVYATYIDGDYMMAKLMEHSWLRNPFVNAICGKIYKTPTKVVWVGDYANEPGDDKTVYEMAWGEESPFVRKDLKKSDFNIDDKYLVNYTKKQYIDMQKYIDTADGSEWIIHPLPLLTVVGNGRGGGDYRGITDVGTWAGDLLAFEDNVPEGFDLLDTFFEEE